MKCSCGRPGAQKINEDPITGDFDILPCKHCRQVFLENTRKTRENEVLKHLNLSGVPKVFRHAKLSDFPEDLITPINNYYIHGEAGIGKTHLMIAHLRSNILKGNRCFFCSESDMMERLRPGVSESQKLSLLFLMNVPFLYLDDVGIVKQTEWSLQNLECLIDKRYAEGRRTTFTSNHPFDEFAGIVGERIASRINGMCEILYMIGNDRRMCEKA